MKAFDELVEIIQRLLGPGGCPWDQKQTLESLRSSLLEESYEVVEAIDLKIDANIKEELGDLFLNAVLMSKIGEKEDRFSLEGVLETINQKLIRRHPHVFGENQILLDVEAVHKQWDQIKKNEKGQDSETSVLDGISLALPSLIRAEKILNKIKKTDYQLSLKDNENYTFTSEEDFGDALLELIRSGNEQGLQADQALRNALTQLEKDFKTYETIQKKKDS
jgi:tetrapyrrole methylase family protein/MazG family protein